MRQREILRAPCDKMDAAGNDLRGVQWEGENYSHRN